VHVVECVREIDPLCLHHLLLKFLPERHSPLLTMTMMTIHLLIAEEIAVGEDGVLDLWKEDQSALEPKKTSIIHLHLSTEIATRDL